MFHKKRGALGIAGAKGSYTAFQGDSQGPKSVTWSDTLEGGLQSVVFIAPGERPVSGWRLRSKSLKSRSHQRLPG
jgi:hypothetical protein